MDYKQHITKGLDEHTIRYYSLARHALYDLIKKIKPKKNSYILMPSLICKEFIEPIYNLNLNLKFYDLDEKLNPKNLKLNKNISILLIINYFGFPFDISKISKECKKFGTIIIEDNAHGLYSSNKEDMLGFRADFGIFSFRKTLPSYDGAFLVCNNNKLIKYLPEPLKIQFDFLSFKYLFKFFAFIFDNYIISSFSRNLKKLYKYLIKNNLSKVLNSYNEKITYPIGPNYISTLFLKFSNKKYQIQRRSYFYYKYLKIVKEHGGRIIFNNLPQNVSPYCLPFYYSGNNINDFAQIIFSDGFMLYRWPNLPIDKISKYPLYYNNLWVINFLE